MRKILFWLFSMLLFVTLPAFAQHGGHGGNGGGGHQVSQPHSGGQRGGERHGGGERQARNGSERRGGGRHEQRSEGYGWGRGERGEARGHFDGRRFDHEYFRGHWGDGYRFYGSRCDWVGPRWGVGSYFWFNGAYFSIIEPIPYWWYDDEVYVDWVDGYGYVLVNPSYPNVYFHVGVRF